MNVDEKEELVKIIVKIEDPEWEVGAEGLWAVRVGDGLYEVRNSPWYTTEINFMDIVKAVAPDENSKPVFVEVYKRGGHRTIQVIFMQEEKKESVLAQLKKMGVTYEGQNKMFYAFNLKPEIDFEEVANYLESNIESAHLEVCYAAQPQPQVLANRSIKFRLPIHVSASLRRECELMLSSITMCHRSAPE